MPAHCCIIACVCCLLLNRCSGASSWLHATALLFEPRAPTHPPTHPCILLPWRKRMLFWSPDQLPCLYCYPDTHLLRRRSRLNMHNPAAQQQQAGAHPFPLAERAATVVEAILEPGDVVFFPSRCCPCSCSCVGLGSTMLPCGRAGLPPLTQFFARRGVCSHVASSRMQVGALHGEPRLLHVCHLPLPGRQLRMTWRTAE